HDPYLLLLSPCEAKVDCPGTKDRNSSEGGEVRPLAGNVAVWCFMFTRARAAQVCRSFSEADRVAVCGGRGHAIFLGPIRAVWIPLMQTWRTEMVSGPPGVGGHCWKLGPIQIPSRVLRCAKRGNYTRVMPILEWSA